MPTELASVVEIALQFVTNSGYVLARLEKTSFDEAKKKWTLIFDVGLTRQQLKTVTIDGVTGKVTAFE